MPKIASFKATFPAKGLESQVAVNTHLPITEAELTEHLEQNPFSYFHIFKPQFHFSTNDKTGKFFSYGRNYFKQLKDQKILVQDEKESIYIYKSTDKQGHSFIGVIANVDADDYEKGKIKKHENTLAEKEDLLVKHISETNLIGEPVLLTYASSGSVNALIEHYVKKEPDVSFEFNGNSKHEIWRVNDIEGITKFKQSFDEINAFYIADGHHRCASMYKFIKQNKLNSSSMLAYLISDEQMQISPFYRLLKLDQDYSIDQIKMQVSTYFNVLESEVNTDGLGEDEILMITSNKSYKLQLKPETLSNNGNPLDMLNVSFLEKLVLQPCFGVEDSRHDNRLTYQSGNVPVSKIIEKITSGEASIVFALAPLKAKDIFDVSDNELVMPPKSTFVEPKLLSGCLILEF